MPNDTQAAYQGFNKEVRFAVVMYGGVSLAIYINGVAQELLKMCQATKLPLAKLRSTDKLYRQIACLLADEATLAELSAFAEGDPKIDARLSKFKERSPSVKLIVDILTGTSAGGINAIFLAKALANGQDMNSLKKLWITQGDIAKLLNDLRSVEDNDLDPPDKPKSLLNSDRMLVELVRAFESMGKDGGASIVPEVDLFVTTTDFRGVTVPLRLLDGVVEEKSFRQVFHFRFDEGHNDFEVVNNPMLAFASRATSSFPFAFEPTRLSRAYRVISQCFDRTKAEGLLTASKRFFPQIVEKDGTLVKWDDRDLVDGGVLDNKPFSYAIQQLSKRRDDFQVDRKLLYIEPSPEVIKRDEGATSPDGMQGPAAPTAVDNALASLTTIPGYETIREDLEKLTERNKLIDRVNLIMANAEQDVFEQIITSGAVTRSEESTKSTFWEDKGLEDVARIMGRAILPYYRLRIAALTDELTRMVTTLSAIDENSEYFKAVREIIKDWRTKHYKDHKDEDHKEDVTPKPRTVLAFLKDYDLTYRLRRLRFVQQKLSRLYFFDDEFSKQLRDRRNKLRKIRQESQANASDNLSDNLTDSFVETMVQVPAGTYRGWTTNSGGLTRTPTEILSWLGGKESPYQPQIQQTCNYFLSRLADIYRDLQKANRKLENPPVSEIQLADPSDFKALFDYVDDARDGFDVKAFESAQPGLGFDDDKVTARLNLLKDRCVEIVGATRSAVGELKSPESGPPEVEPIIINAVRGYMVHYYDNFDDYDAMSFPITYETEVGEAAKVDVMRISPDDAKSLIDLKEQPGRKKVAGEQLAHFGAFLDATWRWNDIMWGRLDGAERLMTALLPDEKYSTLRAHLTKKLHLTIIEEEFLAANTGTLQKEFATALAVTSSGLECRDVVGKITGDLSDDAVKTRLENILKTSFSAEQAYEYIKSDFRISELEPKPLLETIARSTKVTGDILDGVAAADEKTGSKFRYISRLARVFWGLVEVAAPNSIWNMLVGQWLFLLYFFEALLIVTSTLMVKPEVQQFGAVLLVLTLILHLSITTLHDYMLGRKFWYLVRMLIIVAFVVIFIAGGLAIYAFFVDTQTWGKLQGLHNRLTDLEVFQILIPLAVIVTVFVALFSLRALRQYFSLRKKRSRTDASNGS